MGVLGLVALAGATAGVALVVGTVGAPEASAGARQPGVATPGRLGAIDPARLPGREQVSMVEAGPGTLRIPALSLEAPLLVGENVSSGPTVWPGNMPGAGNSVVFVNAPLDGLRKGDRVYIEGATYGSAEFVVYEVTPVPDNGSAWSIVAGNRGVIEVTLVDSNLTDPRTVVRAWRIDGNVPGGLQR